MTIRTPVTCTYFKTTGKYYAGGSTTIETPTGTFDTVIDAVRALRRERQMPGLLAGTEIEGQYHVLVTVADIGTWEASNGLPGGPPYRPGGQRLIPADEPLQLPAYVPMHLRTT